MARIDPFPAGLLASTQFDADALLRAWEPTHRHPHKRALHALACPPAAAHRGRIEVTRWGEPPFVEEQHLPPALTVREDFFTYDAPPAGEAHWHLNFADPHLFGFFEGPLFAQDEMQCAEIPALGAVRDALAARQIPARTVAPDGTPTPILIQDVERRIAVDTQPALRPHREHGLYGNAFARAPWSAILEATTVLTPPVPQNILAVAAPHPGRGAYDVATIRHVLTTATIGFRAARWCSLRRAAQDGAAAPRVVIHTGFWGCGAFGGNRELMVTLQVLAAHAAGLDGLVVHTGDRAGRVDAEAGLSRAASLARVTTAPASQVAALAAVGFPWGVSDGN